MSSDILILSNGPGEITTWVRPVVKALREKLGEDRAKIRISIILSPCPHSTGKEDLIALSYPEIDRVQSSEYFLHFLIWGKTKDNWDWRDRGIVLFLGGDQFFCLVIGKRLGYSTVVYAEWDARWYRFIDRFATMNESVINKVPPEYHDKFTTVGDLIAEVSNRDRNESVINKVPPEYHTEFTTAENLIAEVSNRDRNESVTNKVPPEYHTEFTTAENLIPEVSNRDRNESRQKMSPEYHTEFTTAENLIPEVSKKVNISDETAFKLTTIIGLLPGSKAAKLAQGVPLCIAIATRIFKKRPETKFIIPVAPTLDLPSLASFADPNKNPVLNLVGGTAAELIYREEKAYLKTDAGLEIELITNFPAYERLSQCSLCLTTVGANTAELGSLAIPSIILIPTQQLDAMRSWDGLPGILANLPGIGASFAKIINLIVLRKKRLYAWPNIWAKAEIMPEIIGNIQAKDVANLVIEYLKNPEKLDEMSDRLREIRGQSGAAKKISEIVDRELQNL